MTGKQTEAVWGLTIDEAARKIEKLESDLAAAKEEAESLQATFDLEWKADQRTIKRWQEAHPGNDLVWPDRANMVVWLMEHAKDAGAALFSAIPSTIQPERKFTGPGYLEQSGHGADTETDLPQDLHSGDKS
jgi:hypothetical protein